ncbi:MAG: AEC family transporter [Granulosicoccus sp.]|nr:AEC family transporter [Granulosicoccus sp.]
MSSLVLQIANILAPGMLLAIVGLIWQRRGPRFPVEFITTLVLNVCMPALLFRTLATSEVPIASLGRMALATLVMHVLFTAVAILMLRLADKDWRLCIAHVVGNTGNLGLPVCFLAFGDEGLAYAMTFFAVQCVLLFSIGDAIFAGSASVSRALRSPILHAVWLGVVVRYYAWSMPEIVLQTTMLLGQVVIPLMLITLGVSLAGMRAAQLPSSILWSGIRTLTAAMIGYAITVLMGLEGVARGVLILQTVAPVAVFNYLLALRHGRDSSEVSGLILVTHLSAIVYLPVVLAVLL